LGHREVVLSRLDRPLAVQSDLDEQALRVFEPKLRALNLGLDQIDRQTLLELEASLERIAEAMRHPEQFGTIRLKMTADAAVVVVARSTSEAQFEVGIYPFLLQRKVRVLDRIKSLRPTGRLADLRQQIIRGVEDLAAREDLLGIIDTQNDLAAQASSELEAEKRSVFYRAAIGAARTKAARHARTVSGLIKIVTLVAVVFAAIAVAVPSVLGSPPRWVPVVLAAIVAFPVALDVLEKLAPSAPGSGTRSPLKRLEAKTEKIVFLRRLIRSFAGRGVEDLALGASAAGLISPTEAASLSVETRERRRRRVRVLTIIVLVAAITATAAVIWWRAPNRDVSVGIGQPVDLAGVFLLTVTAPPTCVPASFEAGAKCSVTVDLTNISGEDQHIGAGSFGDIGPRGPTFYYMVSPEDSQEYAIAAVRNDQYFRMNSNSSFDKNALYAGDSTHAILDFDVRDGITSLDEVQLAVSGESRRIHVLLT
jgi:hypothetical protein